MQQQYQKTVGIDEAGRGPWAGPVVAASVLLPTRYPKGLFADSKVLHTRAKEEAYRYLTTHAKIGVGIATPAEIDTINIKQATRLAMERSLLQLPPWYSRIHVDGNDQFVFHCSTKSIIKGDVHVPTISAASIVAKVFRDRLMCLYDELYPGYGFASHAGYGTAAHQEALVKLGPSPIHRLSYKPIQRLMS